MSFPSSILSMVLRNLSSRDLKKSHIVLLSFTIIARRWSQSYSSLFFHKRLHFWINIRILDFTIFTQFVKNTIVTVRVGESRTMVIEKKQSPILPPVASSRRVTSDDTLCGRKNCRSSSSSDDRVRLCRTSFRTWVIIESLARDNQPIWFDRKVACTPASLAIGRRETFGKSRHREYTWSDRRMKMDTWIRVVHLENAKCILKWLKYP